MPTRFTAAILDASALIVIAKLDALADWVEIYGRLLVPSAVEHECVSVPALQDRPDAKLIRDAINSGNLLRASLTNGQLKQVLQWHQQNRLGLGECQTLAYAQGVIGTLALVEDRRARSLARQQQIPYTTIQMSPLEGYIRKCLSYRRAADLTDRVALVMHSDLAVVNALQLALHALATERGEIHGST
jgi:predicted nucleic acid-binding protein